MRAAPERILSGWRAQRLLGAGGLLVRDGAAFRLYHRRDERSARCGRVPAHVVARLKRAAGLAAFRGDPDRLVLPDAPVPPALKALPVPPELGGGLRAGAPLLDRVAEDAAGPGVRIRAAAVRFRADYQLAASPGRLRSETPRALAAARARLEAIEAALGPVRSGLVEMLVLDRFTETALRHVTGQGEAAARAALIRLAAAYGLGLPDQEAGSAFASA